MESSEKRYIWRMETTDSTSLLYKGIIGVQAPRVITAVTKDEASGKITVRIEHDPEKIISCPVCSRYTKL